MSLKVYLFGGIGNQFFQAVAAAELSKQRNLEDVEHCFSLHNSFKMQHSSNLSDLFSIDIVSAESAARPYSKFKRYSLRILSQFTRQIVTDSTFRGQLSDPSMSSGVSLFGYFQTCWQGEEFSYAAQEFIKSNMKASLTREIGHHKFFIDNEIVIHIRGGDFKNSKIHNVCDESYYSRSIKKLRDKYGQMHSVIITDDMNFAEELCAKAAIEDYQIVTDAGPYQSMQQIMRRKFRVLSNSTFAFLASELGSSIWTDSVVIAPDLLTLNSVRTFTLTHELNMELT